MPLKDLMQNQLTAANLTAINAALAQLESALLGKTVNLTPDERQRYGSINEQNKLLVNKTNDYRLSSPQFNAPQVDWTEFLSDFTTRATLEGFLQRLASLMEQISDTKILHDNDNYQQSLSQYSYISYLSTQNVPGTTSIKDDLSQFFPNS
jgi:hypothetical protein